MIPIWGPGKEGIHDFQCGNWGWGLFNTAVAVSDVFYVKLVVTWLPKGAWKVISHIVLFSRKGKVVIKHVPEKEINITLKQLQKKFKHAADFGVSGNYSPANAAKFQAAIQQHLVNPTTQVITGIYRGQAATFYFNA